MNKSENPLIELLRRKKNPGRSAIPAVPAAPVVSKPAADTAKPLTPASSALPSLAELPVVPVPKTLPAETKVPAPVNPVSNLKPTDLKTKANAEDARKLFGEID